MTRTEVRMSQNPPQIWLERHPQNRRLLNRVYLPFGGSSTDPPFIGLAGDPVAADAVKAAGAHLWMHMAANPDIQQALAVALGAGAGQSYPLFPIVDTDLADGLPWETLYDPVVGFLALDRRWPIARVPDPVDPDPIGVKLLASPLRMAFVLSASGLDALPQWNAIEAALATLTAPMSATIFMSQDSVKDAVHRLGDPRFEVREIGNRDRLLDELDTIAPQVLHFFCHGEADHLLVARRSDQDADTPGPGFAIEAAQLLERYRMSAELWLVTLNACLGAAGGGAGQSVARSLAQNGFPAVVGMREIISDRNDADAFCERFFSAFVSRIQQAFDTRARVELDWAGMVRDARVGLLARHEAGQPASVAAASHKEWTLPVLYVRRAAFEIEFAGAAPAPVPAAPAAPAAPPAAAQPAPVPAAPPAPAPPAAGAPVLTRAAPEPAPAAPAAPGTEVVTPEVLERRRLLSTLEVLESRRAVAAAAGTPAAVLARLDDRIQSLRAQLDH